MLKNFSAVNFRCFSNIHLRQLGRVNLIAGENNVGKTALLEAIRLHVDPTNSQLPIKINEERGIEDPAKAVEEVCGWLFYDKKPAHGIELSSADTQGMTRRLAIRLVDSITSREQYPETEKTLRENLGPDLYGFPRLILKFHGPEGEERVSVTVSGQIGGGTRSASLNARVSWGVRSVFVGSSALLSERDVAFFSELEIANRLDEILPPLRILEPRLQKLSSPVLAGKPVIHGNIGLSRQVPLPLMGEGLRRLLSILLAIANVPNGIVLIDEIENGLHYSVMKGVWKAIGQAARAANVQVFATTHSWECIQAAHHAFKENGPYELRYHRLDRADDGIIVKSLDEELLERVQDTDLEIR
jgi:hypothetical protein